MTTPHDTPNNTIPPDWAAADRRRPIEDLLGASTAEGCFGSVVEAVRQIDPAEVASVEVLVEALATARISDDEHSHYFRRGIDAVLKYEPLRPALMLGLAIRGMPGAAGETAQAYAALAVELARWLAASAWQASTDDEKAVVRRVEQRVRIARHLCTGWGAMAAGLTSDYQSASTTTHAAGIGAEVEVASVYRAILPDPESREEEAAIDEGWRARLDALYGKFGYGVISARVGWATVIEDALEQFDASLLPDEREAFRVSDIKEKYGTLRLYTAGAPDAVDVIVEIAERRSALTCDRCGDHGRVGGKGWLACRCARHEKN
jgi:hypothetical protein